MQFGVMLAHRWLYAAGNTIADFAREAEALGYTSLWVTDHIIVPSYRHCQVVEVETRIRRAAAPLRSYLLSRRPAPYP